jgi:DNA-binding HxlR family transcriptional regulator
MQLQVVSGRASEPVRPEGCGPSEQQLRLDEPSFALEILGRVAERWSIFVVASLGQSPKRFVELRRAVGRVSSRMLTITLRKLERDGLVTRTDNFTTPRRVEYELTPLGQTLLASISALATWAEAHRAQILQARDGYDRKLGVEVATPRVAEI